MEEHAHSTNRAGYSKSTQQVGNDLALITIRLGEEEAT
jgi:hypothetical protein